MKQVIVTISRQLGSGGAYLGQEIAKGLGIRYVDRDILAEAAKILQEDPSVLEGREERVSTFMENFFTTMALGTPDTAGYIPPPFFRLIYDEQIFNAEAAIIRKIAQTESAVIVGRLGYYILNGHPGLVNVFFHAPRQARQRRIMELYGVSASQALERIDESDRCRRKVVAKFTRGRWSDALNFDLCIDTARAGFDLTVETVVAMARRVQNGAEVR